MYISSNANRFYAARENAYGRVPAIEAKHRLPAVKLTARQQSEVRQRRDKTGSRTFAGLPPGGRRKTTFGLTTYLASWDSQQGAPGYAALIEASMGGTPLSFTGASAGSGSTGSTLVFAGAHGLSVGQAVSWGGEIRFVQGIVDATTVQLNAPFTSAPSAGENIRSTLTYMPATELPSVSIFDYWDPATAVQRILCGAAVNRMEIRVNGDFHEMEFSGAAQDLIDSGSFAGGIGSLEEFPAEPSTLTFDYGIVPGHMGQAWIGNTPERFFTVTKATFALENDLEMRAREFGSSVPLGIAPGQRSATVDLEIFAQDTVATKALYEAAKQQSAIGVMFQLGEVEGQLLGVYLKSVTPEVPEFDDSESRLRWRFRESRAQGTIDDEIAVALG